MPLAIGIIVVIYLIGFNACSERVLENSRGEVVCNRASCWDDKSGRFIGKDEWDQRQRDRRVY